MGPRDRRQKEIPELLMTGLCVLCTVVTVLVVAPTVLDTSSDVDQAQSEVKDVQQLARENTKRISEIAALQQKINLEGRERRDQSCRRDEREHKRDVKRLRDTYDYLDRLPRSAYGDPLTQAIVRGLPDLEASARRDVAPPFCDAPGVGLREPDPKLPPRRRFDRLLRP